METGPSRCRLMTHQPSSWLSEEVGFSGEYRKRRCNRREQRSDRFFNQSRAQAAGADPNTFVALADHSTNSLNIRIEHTPGFIVRVTDVVAGYRLFEANLTHKCHGRTPSR